MFIFARPFICYQEKGAGPLKLGARRATKSFYNNYLLKNNLLYIIEAKMFNLLSLRMLAPRVLKYDNLSKSF